MTRKFFNIACFIILTFVISGCTGDRCVDADDFGYPTFTIPSRYNMDQTAQPQQIFGDLNSDGQVARWIDSGFVTNGRPLVIVVKNWRYLRDGNTSGKLSAWCPWYGGTDDGSTLSTYTRLLRVCKWTNGVTADPQQWHKDAQIQNAPCLLKKGIGLYGLIARPNADPNSSPAQMASPDPSNFVTFHLGDPHPNYNLYDNYLQPGDVDDDINIDDTTAPAAASSTQVMPQLAGGIVYQYENAPDIGFHSGKLYFKILDKYYNDNTGQYIVTIKSGVETNNSDPIEFMVSMVRQFLLGSGSLTIDTGSSGLQQVAVTSYNYFADHIADNTIGAANSAVNQGVSVALNYLDENSTPTAIPGLATSTKNGIVQNMFKNILNQPAYKTSVSAILTLYVAITAIGFLIGTVKITHTDLIIRMIKIAAISTLLNPDYGWTFFSQYLFVFFLDGSEYILQQIRDAGAVGPGAGSIFGMLLSLQLLKKLAAMVFTSWFGAMFGIIYIIALTYFLIVSARSAILYISSLIMISMLIIMGPIFACFSLFGITRSLFENWIKQLTFYALQGIILVAILTFISAQVRHQIYANLGFRVCMISFPDFGPLFQLIDPSDGGTPTSLLTWFAPDPYNSSDFIDQTVTIPVPEDHLVNNNGQVTYCPAFGCNEARYYQFPFLDPTSTSDMQRLHDFMNGTFTQVTGLVYLVVLIYLLMQLNNHGVSVAQSLTGASANTAQIERVSLIVAQHMIDPIKEKVAARAKETGVYKAGTRAVEVIKQQTVGRVAGALDARKRGQREEKALTNQADHGVLQRMREKHGVHPEDMNHKAKDVYQAKLKATLVDTIKAKNPLMSQKDVDAQAKELSAAYKDPLQLRNALSQAKHGSTFNKLSPAQQEEVRDLMNQSGSHSKEKLAEKQYGKSLDKLSPAERMHIDQLSSTSLSEAAIVARNTQQFKELYAQEAKELKQERKDAKIMRTGNDWQAAGYGKIEEVFAKAMGDTDRFEFHDGRNMTRSEIARENAREDQFAQSAKQVTALSQSVGVRNILDPAYQARLELARGNPLDPRTREVAGQIGALARADAAKSVHDAVKQHMYGEKYARGFMKKDEFQETIRRLDAIEANLLGREYIKDKNGNDMSLAPQDKHIARKYEFEDKSDPVSQRAMKVLNDREQMIKDEIRQHKERIALAYGVQLPPPPKPEQPVAASAPAPQVAPAPTPPAPQIAEPTKVKREETAMTQSYRNQVTKLEVERDKASADIEELAKKTIEKPTKEEGAEGKARYQQAVKEKRDALREAKQKHEDTKSNIAKAEKALVEFKYADITKDLQKAVDTGDTQGMDSARNKLSKLDLDPLEMKGLERVIDGMDPEVAARRSGPVTKEDHDRIESVKAKLTMLKTDIHDIKQPQVNLSETFIADLDKSTPIEKPTEARTEIRSDMPASKPQDPQKEADAKATRDAGIREAQQKEKVLKLEQELREADQALDAAMRRGDASEIRAMEQKRKQIFSKLSQGGSV